MDKTSIVANLLILVIPPLPGIIAYLIADRLAGDLWLTLFPVAVGLITLLGAFPLTVKIVNRIEKQTHEIGG